MKNRTGVNIFHQIVDRHQPDYIKHIFTWTKNQDRIVCVAWQDLLRVPGTAYQLPVTSYQGRRTWGLNWFERRFLTTASAAAGETPPTKPSLETSTPTIALTRSTILILVPHTLKKDGIQIHSYQMWVCPAVLCRFLPALQDTGEQCDI